MRQALEALEDAASDLCSLEDYSTAFQEETITALRQAIAEAEKQEPYGYFRYDIRLDSWVQDRESTQGVAFYTAPPKREWAGLTDEEVGRLTVFDGLHHVEVPILADFACAIEAKLKEKNNG